METSSSGGMTSMRYVGIVAAVAVCLAVSATAQADSFLAESNQFGYQGTVQNVTQPNTVPVAFPTPRDGVVDFVHNIPVAYGTGNRNEIQSNWFQHPQTSQDPGFFQLSDLSGATVTSATGGWTQNGSLWDFSLTVTGANATYANSGSRLWQPDVGMALGGTFTSYSYTLTDTGMTTYVENTEGWRFNYNVAPTGITGSFDGTFVSTFGDTYLVHLDLNKTYWDDTNWSDTYTDSTGTHDYYTCSKFGAPAFGAPIPEPLTMAGLAMGIGGLVTYVRKRRTA